VTADARGWRIALVPAALLDPPAPARTNPRERLNAPPLDLLIILEENGYGVLQLPPPGKHTLLLAVIADQVAEYAHHGYAVVAIGVRGAGGRATPPDCDALHWRRLAPLLRHRGVALPPRHFIRADADGAAESERLAAFLSGHDLPEAERQRWRR
jgi:hypothetical protein